MKKNLAIFLSIIFLGISIPSTSQAQWVVSDPGNTTVSGFNLAENIWQVLAEEVLKPLAKKIADQALTKITQETLSWANGGPNGGPGFVNNLPDYLQSESTRSILHNFDYANIIAQSIIPDGSGIDPEGDAQNNYNAMISGEADSARAVVRTIASVGSNALNGNPLQDIVTGEADLTKKLLGSQAAKDEFSNGNFKAGGWEGYLSLLGEGSTDLNLVQNVAKYTLQEANESASNALTDLQTPQKFLNKTECVEYDETGTCTREVTTTQGNLINSQVQRALQKGFDQGANFDGVAPILTNIILNSVNGLISEGFSKLTNSATNLLFNPGDTSGLLSQTGGGFQSQYDVLGITSNGSGSGGTGGGITSQGILGSNIFICGPENESEGNCQAVINFQNELQSNINLLEEEKSYYDGIRTLLVDSVDVVMEFDKCIPGPDYDWESRYKDVLSTFGNEEQGQINAIGFNDTRNMTQDPRVTIPGGVEMVTRINSILAQTQQESTNNKARLDRLNSALSTLKVIKQEILQDFNQQKGDFNINLVLFEENWDALSQSQKESAIQYAYDNGYYLNLGLGPIGSTTNTPANILANDPVRARDAVISASWNIWRTVTDSERKRTLRASFYVNSTNLSGEEQIAIAKTQYTNLQYNINQSYNTAIDCLVFKSYALGIQRPTIAAITESNQSQAEKVTNLAGLIRPFEPQPSGGGIFGNGFSYFDNTTVRSDAAIKSFLQSENALQNVGNNTSVFETLLMTTPSSISNSILGFSSETAKQEYFDTYYNDEDLEYDTIKNKLTIKDMYQVDRIFARTNRIPAGFYGHLFCRNQGSFEIINSSGGGDTTGTNCWRSFYSADKYDYQLTISGI